MKKILFVATVPEHFRCFYLPYFALFKECGWEVSCACNCAEDLPNCDYSYKIKISRSPFDLANLLAFKQLNRIIQEKNYQIIHCNTPTGGLLTRLAAKKARKRGAKVIYTAHGFHFFNGAPLFSWLIYFPIERVLSRITDCLVTINGEDYITAKKYFKAGNIVCVHGVGYDSSRFMKPSQAKKSMLRSKFGFSDDDILLIYVAELNENKNQRMLITALQTVVKTNTNTKLLLVGTDRVNGKNNALAISLGLEKHVHFLGQRNDVCEIMPMCDLTVASSKREGLPVNIMESLACGVPVVATDNRGHRELVMNGKNGYLIKPDDHGELAQKIIEITGNINLHTRLSDCACTSVSRFCSEYVLEEMKAVYGGV